MASQSPTVLAELANRINNKDADGKEDAANLSDKEIEKKENNGKKDADGKHGRGKHFKRSKSQDHDKSPNHGKKKGKAKVQKMDSDVAEEGDGPSHKKGGGFLSNLKKAFKKKPSDKHRKLSDNENQLKTKSRSESDLIAVEGQDGKMRHSWASGLDDVEAEEGKGGKKGKKSALGSFFEKRIRESFRNKFKIKSRKSSLDKKGHSGGSPGLSQRPMSDSNLYSISRDADFFDDSFFTVSLTTDNDSFVSTPESVTIGDFMALDSLDSSPTPAENNVAKSRIQVAPKNRRKPTRFRGSKSMSDTTDNVASMSSLGMISEVASDDDLKLSPDFSKEENRSDNDTVSGGHGDRPSIDVEVTGIQRTTSSLSASVNEPEKHEDDGKEKDLPRSNSLLADMNGPAAELSRVLTASLSSLEKEKSGSRLSADKLGSKSSRSSSKSSLEKPGSKSSLDKTGSKSSLHEFEIRRLSLRSASSKELPKNEEEADLSSNNSFKLGRASIDEESPVFEQSPRKLSAEASVEVKPVSTPSVTEAGAGKPITPTSTPTFEQVVESKEKIKESKIPVHSKPFGVKTFDDSSVLLSNDIHNSNDEKINESSVEENNLNPILNGTRVADDETQETHLSDSLAQVEYRMQRSEPSPKLKSSGLPVLDRSKIPASVPDDLSDSRDRSKSASSRLTSQSYRFVNKGLSLDDDFRSNDDKGSINRSKSLNCDPKRLRFANKALLEREPSESVNNGDVSDKSKPNWISIAKEKQRKRDSMEITEQPAEEEHADRAPVLAPKPAPTTDKKPEIPKKPKSLKVSSPPAETDNTSKDFVRTTRSLKIQSSAAPVVDMDLRGGESATSAANCAVCGKVSYMFGRFELNGQYFHKNCARCSVCGNFVAADSLTLKDKAIFCRLHNGDA